MRKERKYHHGRVLEAFPVAAVYTIGHSTHPIREFVDLLKHYRIRRLVDVRRFPLSRKNPQFEKQTLKMALQEAGIQYLWMGEGLGGYRKEGYVKHTKTPIFKKGLEELIRLANQESGSVAVMCAELLWFRCHRRFIADALMKRGLRVIHILDSRRVHEHSLRTGVRKDKADIV